MCDSHCECKSYKDPFRFFRGGPELATTALSRQAARAYRTAECHPRFRIVEPLGRQTTAWAPCQALSNDGSENFRQQDSLALDPRQGRPLPISLHRLMGTAFDPGAHCLRLLLDSVGASHAGQNFFPLTKVASVLCRPTSSVAHSRHHTASDGPSCCQIFGWSRREAIVFLIDRNRYTSCTKEGKMTFVTGESRFVGK